jgi:hypothetical protein
MILLEVTVVASGSEVDSRIGNPQALRGPGNEQNAPGNARQPASEPGLHASALLVQF